MNSPVACTHTHACIQRKQIQIYKICMQIFLYYFALVALLFILFAHQSITVLVWILFSWEPSCIREYLPCKMDFHHLQRRKWRHHRILTHFWLELWKLFRLKCDPPFIKISFLYSSTILPLFISIMHNHSTFWLVARIKLVQFACLININYVMTADARYTPDA